MNKKYFSLLLLWVLICYPVSAKEQPEKTCSTTYDRIINPQKSTNVYIIKDVHCNYVIQRQIVNELENIDNNMGIGFIAAEGSSGELSFDIIKNFPDFKILSSATDSFMKTADLLGVECFASNSAAKGKNVPVFGLEDTELYIKNKSCFLDAVSNSKIIKPIAEQAHCIAKNDILTKIPSGKARLLKILYNNDTENLINIVGFLKTYHLDLQKFKVLNKYYSLHKKLKSIRRENLENESKKIHKYLKVNNNLKLSKKLSKVMKKYYAGIFSFDRFIRRVNDIVKINGLNIQTPCIDDYINLDDEIARIDFYCLNDEIASISNQLEISVTKNIVPNDLLEKRKILSLVEKLYNTSLKFNEYKILTDFFNTDNSSQLSKKIYNLISEYKSLKQVVPSQDKFILLSKPFIDFYNIASKRDKIMADKFLSFLPENFQDKSYIIVAGGYHTEGLSDILSKKGINHKIIIPKIPKETSFSNELYMKRITGAEKNFDLALNQYFMGLQVWLNFSSAFPDEASRTSAELFRFKLISFLAAEAPYNSAAINAWLADVSKEQGITVSIIAQNREGVICSIANNITAEQKFLFEISVDKNAMPLFRHNKYYEDCIDALYVEPSNTELIEISGSIFSSAILQQAITPGADALNDLSRFMFMLRLNNPRVFYETAKQISQLINENFPGNKIQERSQAVMRFNLVLDEVEAANTFYDNRLISLNEVDGFITARRAIVKTAYNINGSNKNFPLILDTASKQAELSISLLFMLGVLDSDWLIDHYFALFSWLVSQNSLTPDISKLNFPAQLFDRLPPVQVSETNLAQRIEAGIDHINSDKYNFNRALKFAQIAVERFSMPFRVQNNDTVKSPEELFKYLKGILADNEPGSVLLPDEFDSFMEQLLAEDAKILQPLLRATGDYSINLSKGYIKAITNNPDIFISTAKSPSTSYYALSSLFARQGNIKRARNFLNKYIEEINRLKKESGFDANTQLIDETAHQITLIFSKPWVTDFQKYQLVNIYDSFYDSTDGVSESDTTNLDVVNFREITVKNSTRNFVSEGRLSKIPQGVFNLDVVSLDEGRMVDFSKFAYLPLPGYLQIDRPGKTIPQIAEEETRKNPKMLLAAINGSNADWSAPNAFLIRDNKLITKPVPGANQKERVPLIGNFSILAFDDNNRAKLTRVNIEYDKLVTDENIHYGIQGQVILEDGKIYPSPPKPEMLGYPQENEVGFNTVTKIRASFSAIGITEDGSILLITMIGKINVPAVANLLKQAGAKDAVLLGGSGDAQQVTFSADPVLAEERRDKPLRAGTYKVRPVNMGLMFFSNSITAEQMTNSFVKDVLNQHQNRQIIESSL